MKDLQKLRRRPNGISVVGLALGKRFKVEEELTANGLFNTQSGGMVNMQSVKTGKAKIVDDAYDTGIGTQFSAETNIRDQDEEMMKYIERQLNKQKGEKKSQHDSDTGTSKKYFTPEEAALYALPAYLKQTSSQKSEEMLSNQMLNGIPEVDLGIEAKIKNIEATEEAKQKLIQDQRKKKDGPSFVPVNIAANFTTHSERCKLLSFLQEGYITMYNTFFILSDNLEGKKRRYDQGANEQNGALKMKRDPKKATDDFHFDKFRNKFRKH